MRRIMSRTVLGWSVAVALALAGLTALRAQEPGDAPAAPAQRGRPEVRYPDGRSISPQPTGRPFRPQQQMQVQQPPAQGVAIRAGRLFDAKAGTNLINQVVLIQGERITEVGPAAQVRIPPGAWVIDLSNATVLPGIIDHHAHMFSGQPNESLTTLSGLNLALKDMSEGGFTSLVDMGATSYASVSVRDAINKGWVMGPRMQVAGPQMNPRKMSYGAAPDNPVPFFEDPTTWQNMQNVNSPWLARAAVREHANWGADWIKVYMTEDHLGSGLPSGAFYPDGRMINVPSLTLEEVQAIVDEAHWRGLKTVTHAYGGEGLRRVLVGGMDLPMHAAVSIHDGINGKRTGMDEETVRMFLQPLPNGKRRMVLYTLWDLMGNMEREDLEHTGGKTSRFLETEKAFKMMNAAGVKQVFGSGVYGNAHGAQAMQFAIMVKWGMTPAQAIQTATINAAESLNYDWSEQVGTLEKGKYADVIAVSGNPLTDITEMERVKFVMKGGIVFRNELTPGPAPASATPRETR
jgi:imidazolonepropionase-like amidohydrolase